ncbi:MAG: hypothetical protein F4X03_03655 [Dehalococcoidia bacterium]|nr:hypothetical protein [Gemmatimonadota bacterium]MYD28001.1 hypothetical protein [Dehalococcoidia bacterium]
MQRDDASRSVMSPVRGSDDERQLLASLRELVTREGPVKAAEALGVGYRTVMRAIETKAAHQAHGGRAQASPPGGRRRGGGTGAAAAGRA